MNSNNQKAKLIARLQTYVPLYEWPLLDELAESGGPSEREAVLENCLNAFLRLRTDSRTFHRDFTRACFDALKNAAPQQSN